MRKKPKKRRNSASTSRRTAPAAARTKSGKSGTKSRAKASGVEGRRAKPKSGGVGAKKAAPGKQASSRSTGRGAGARTKRAPSSSRTRAHPARPGVSALEQDVRVTGKLLPRYEEILAPDALAFLAELHRRFDATRKRLLTARAARQARFDAGDLPDFLPQTRHIREDDWKIAPIPKDLIDRRVEITGPVDRKMIINALNSGANVYMADFEDANSPTWSNNVEGQLNLKDRWAGTLAFRDPASGKDYAIGRNPAVLIVRPRGWHLDEVHVEIDGQPIAGALFDFGLYYFHNVEALLAKGTGPYFYLPKLEGHIEARLWNDVFRHAEERFGHPRGTIKATVLIETLPAAFEMDEILWELRDHIAGLNAGRWDYIFSFIKKFAKRAEYVLPDRSQVVMGKAFLRAYALLLIKTCHRRGAFAMGGMAAQIPVKNDSAANEAAFDKVRADKQREVDDGHDGTWVAHPDLVPVARQIFDRLPGPNQLARLRQDVDVDRDELLQIHEGTKTEAGFRANIRVGVQYIEAWLRGRGAVPIYNLMEDAATAEICRAQIWQWLTYGAVLENGIKLDDEFFERALGEEMDVVKSEVGVEAFESGRFPEAIELFRKLSLSDNFAEFLTIPAYRLIA
jgi:malate synthase